MIGLHDHHVKFLRRGKVSITHIMWYQQMNQNAIHGSPVLYACAARRFEGLSLSMDLYEHVMNFFLLVAIYYSEYQWFVSMPTFSNMV